MADKWQGTVEIGFITSYANEARGLKGLDFRDMDGDLMFDTIPYAADGTPMDGGEGVCRQAGIWFVLNKLGWAEYDQVCRRMRGSTIRVDLLGIDLG